MILIIYLDKVPMMRQIVFTPIFGTFVTFKSIVAYESQVFEISVWLSFSNAFHCVARPLDTF